MSKTAQNQAYLENGHKFRRFVLYGKVALNIRVTQGYGDM
jgi:hypothetical protein